MTTTAYILKPAVMTVSDICRWARIGRTKLYEEINRGALRTFKLGRRTLIRADDAQAWLDACQGTQSAQVQL